jgi:archaellum biogenesis ATPase FlaH
MKTRDYGFLGDPFDEDSFDYEMRGRKQEWDKITRLMNKALTESGSRTILILGDYGYGKSFTLEKMVKQFHANRFENSRKTVVASIRLAESEPEARIGLSFVSKIFYEIGLERLHDIATKTNVRRLPNISKDMKSIIGALKKKSTEAFDWLTAQSLGPSDKKALGIKRILRSSRQAIGVLYEFQKMLKSASFDNLVVLIDEFEYVVNVYSEKQVTTILHTFKEIYDEFIRVNTRKPGSIANFVFVIAMTPRGWDYLTETETKLSRKTGGGGITPWMERIRHEQFMVTLKPLDKGATEQVIKDRIKEKRVGYKKFPYPTFPFIHPGFFDVVYASSEGNPRYIFQHCDLVLEEALAEGVKEIDKKYARKALRKYNIGPSGVS